MTESHQRGRDMAEMLESGWVRELKGDGSRGSDRLASSCNCMMGLRQQFFPFLKTQRGYLFRCFVYRNNCTQQRLWFVNTFAGCISKRKINPFWSLKKTERSPRNSLPSYASLPTLKRGGFFHDGSSLAYHLFSLSAVCLSVIDH